MGSESTVLATQEEGTGSPGTHGGSRGFHTVALLSEEQAVRNQSAGGLCEHNAGKAFSGSKCPAVSADVDRCHEGQRASK